MTRPHRNLLRLTDRQPPGKKGTTMLHEHADLPRAVRQPPSNAIALCLYSRAAGGQYTDRDGLPEGPEFVPLDHCPLGLSAAEARRCPCKLRQSAGEIQTKE